MLEVAGGEVAPSGHGKQSKSVVRPVRSLYFPAAQSVQAAMPAVALYLPVTHAAHGPPSGPVQPAAHSGVTQSSSASLPAGEDLPAGHDVHTGFGQVYSIFLHTVSLCRFVSQPDRMPPELSRFQDNLLA
jgi:hypothetical protein